ncbi:urea transporter [Nitrososphaera sp.]|uniref:urea transporter n=1 Tax=Nitrososphaera sp. TaxID=1971748 RepID=UPI00307E1D10
MAVPTYSTGDPLLDFLYTLFNGIAEVPLFSSPITGVLILAGVFLASRKAGAMMVLAGLIGAGVAILAGAPYGLVTFGLFGYNSILTGMAFWSGPFVKANKATFFISIFGAAITAFTWMAFSHLMGDLFVLNGLAQSWAIPGFTSSFIFTTWALMYASKRFGHDIWPAPPPPQKEELIAGSNNPNTNDGFKWTVKEFMIATLKGVSQVTFVENWKTGVFWVVGLTLAFELAPFIAGVQDRPWWTNAYTAQWDEFSPLYLAGLMALLGSGIGVAMAILTKLPTAEIRLGLHGFNQVLVMIALTSFVPLTPQSFMMAVFATIGCSFLMPALQRFFGQWGLPALTGPFVFTAWVFLLATSGFQNIPAGIGWSRP